MSENAPGLVDVVRDFLLVDRAVRHVAERYREGQLPFHEVAAVFADDEATPLFRLKERCHQLFRPEPERPRRARHKRHREVLFDLAVGSLFHEALKFRESYYQREVYGPRVRDLRGEAGREAAALFREFERILGGVSERLEEGLSETLTLLDRSREQLMELLGEYDGDGPLVRFLIENRERVEAVFQVELEALLALVHGSAARGYERAGRSYLESGYYAEADEALTRALARGGERAELEPLCAHARGMAAYLAGDYGESTGLLARWLDAAVEPSPAMVELAHSAVAAVDRLSDDAAVVEAAGGLTERLGALRGAGAPAQELPEAGTVPRPR